MKMKMSCILVLLLLVFSIVPAVMAQDDAIERIDEETGKEVDAMTTSYGAEMRLLQLERAVTKAIIIGEEVVAEVQDNGDDSSELEVILSELEAVKEEIQGADPSSEDAVQTFVDLKKDSIELVKSFRGTAKGLLSNSDASALRERLKTMNKSELEQLTNRIQEMRRNHNAERLGEILGKMGIENKNLVEKVRNGEAKTQEVRNELREGFNQMPTQEKRNALNNLKQERVKKQVALSSKLDQVKAKYLERRENRISNRLSRLEESGRQGPGADALRAYIQERLQRIEGTQAGVENGTGSGQQETPENLQNKGGNSGQ